MVLRVVLISGSFAALLGLFVWAARRAGERRRANRCADRTTLAGIGDLLAASRQSSEAVLAALERSLRRLDGTIDGLLVFVPQGDELACVYAGGARTEHFRDLRLRRDDLDALPCAAAANGCRARLRAGAKGLVPTDRAAFAAPMQDAQRLMAVAYVASADARALAQIDPLVAAIERAAVPYCIALEREADRADATYDGLTGLLTPRAFRQRLHDEIAALHRDSPCVLSLWFVDTDRFKTINDRLGHRAGDSVLVAIASLLRAHLVPEVDLAARNGGDEFCGLIRASTKTAAIERAGAFCDAVRAHDFGIEIGVTASVGVATFPYDAGGSAALLEAADAAMYHAKRSGRDRVAFAVEPGTYATLNANPTRIPYAGSRRHTQCASDTGGPSTQSPPC